MIKTTELSKKYGEETVLNIESLEIPKGQSFGLVGNNGAGKTTFFNLLLDLILPTTGYITNNEIRVNTSEEWKPFTSAFIDESFNDEIIGKKKYLRDLSKGNQKKAGIVGALIGDPEVVVLDEPFANLDPTTQIRLKKILKTLTEDKAVTFLISSHDLNHVTEVCERIVVLEKGDIIKDIVTSTETLKELESHFSV